MNNDNNNNDGGIVLTLLLMAATIAYALFQSVLHYERSTSSSSDHPCRPLRLLSGWSNIGNSVAHILLTMCILSNAKNDSEYWLNERKLGGIEGPVVLAIINLVVGLSALLCSHKLMMLSLGWNLFVVIAGTVIPDVWPRFIDEGLATWPYTVILLWFFIFVYELTAVTCSVAHTCIFSSRILGYTRV
mmetsp:Transcript_15608/g.23645  ORF Transcript_15608/g.23645 Transcript_15608/m.23645 type:complete len:188 (+) Transcript_15608:71-634(+)